MRLNQFGQVAHDFWPEVPVRFSGVSIDAFMIMPNHLHTIIVIQAPATVVGDVGKGEKGEGTSPLQDAPDVCRGAVTAPLAVTAPTVHSRVERPALGQIVAYYKYQTTKRINQLRDMAGVPFWQRNYWEQIIRDERSLGRIREYIEANPARWDEDQLHPDAPPNPFNQWPSR